MLVVVVSVVKKLGIIHLVLGHEIYKITLGTIIQPLGRITHVLVTVGKVVCQMIFLVLDTKNYNLLLGLDFLMKIGIVVDVEKGVIQVHNGLGMVVEVLPLNMVNMLHWISRPETSRHDQMKKGFNKMSLEQWCTGEVPSWDSTSTLLDFAECIDDSFFEGNLREEEEIADDDLSKIFSTEEFMIEELNDHSMN